MDSSSPSNDPLSTPGPYTIPVGDPGPFDSPPSSDEHAEYSRNLPTGTRKNPPGSPNLVQNVDCSPITHSFSTSACGRLIGRSFNRHELPSLIEAIFSGGDEGDAIGCLCRDDAQTFIDVIDEVLDSVNLSPQIRKKCLKSLYRMCGRHALLPRSLTIPVCYDRTGAALCRGGFADVWKGEHCGREVAVKVLRTYSNSDLRKVIGRFCKEVVTWKTLRHPNVLPLIGVTMSETRFAMVSDWMANGNINNFVKTHPDANRLQLLADVARGLIYIHSQGMIHGDLKGANILIDQTRNARLADFGLLTIVSDPANLLSPSSCTQGGTARWMSPELIAPQQFGFENSHRTKSSDCYALGMVIYETITGRPPFHRHADLTVLMKVSGGEHPPREVGFTDSLWGILERCWAPPPNARPNIEDVLQCLEMVTNLSELPSPGADEETEKDDDDWDFTNDSSVTDMPRATDEDSNMSFFTPDQTPGGTVTTVTSTSAWFLDVLDFLNAEQRIMVTLSAIFIIIGSLPVIPAIASGVGGTFFTLRVAQSASVVAVSLRNWLKPAQEDVVERQQTVEGGATMAN